VNFTRYDVVMQHDLSPLPASRARLAAVLRAAKDVVSVDLAAEALAIERGPAAKLLSRWRAQGWLRRIGPGLYVSVPLDLAGSEQVITDPWVLVPTLFGQCYIGGWTAAHHWELTEQLFNETVVFTTRRVVDRRVIAQGAIFTLHKISAKYLFGLKTLWRGSARVAISDPTRTLIDMISAPETGGGIDHVAECLRTYLGGETGDRDLLIHYAEQLGNGAVFKRLGFLADQQHDEKLVSACRIHLTKGYAKLDPALSSSNLVTSWRLWVPARWKGNAA
jgi:predicted transcriptional regulator of viral defense system